MKKYILRRKINRDQVKSIEKSAIFENFYLVIAWIWNAFLLSEFIIVGNGNKGDFEPQ